MNTKFEEVMPCPVCGKEINTSIQDECPECGYCWILNGILGGAKEEEKEEEKNVDEDIINQNNSSSRGER